MQDYLDLKSKCASDVEVKRRGFNNEVQHLEKQEGACYSKCLWENNTGI
jgi:hypothetical protein